MEILAFLVGLTGYYSIKALYKFYNWKYPNDKTQYNKNRHITSSFLDIIVLTVICFIMKENITQFFFLISLTFLTKIIVFDTIYNNLKGYKLYYLSTDNLVNKLLKPFEKLFLIICIILWIILIFNYSIVFHATS